MAGFKAEPLSFPTPGFGFPPKVLGAIHWATQRATQHQAFLQADAATHIAAFGPTFAAA